MPYGMHDRGQAHPHRRLTRNIMYMQPSNPAKYNPSPISPPARSSPLRYFTSTRRCITRPCVTRPAMHGVDQAWRRPSATHGVLEGRWLLEKALQKDAKLRDTYKKKFNYNDIRRDILLA